jgi:hypothetical protein
LLPCNCKRVASLVSGFFARAILSASSLPGRNLATKYFRFGLLEDFI